VHFTDFTAKIAKGAKKIREIFATLAAFAVR